MPFILFFLLTNWQKEGNVLEDVRGGGESSYQSSYQNKENLLGQCFWVLEVEEEEEEEEEKENK